MSSSIPTTQKITISIPTFVRFNIESINLTDEQKKTALTIGQNIATENTQVLGNFVDADGGLICQNDLSVGGNINITPQTSNTMVFNGRVNLSNSPFSYQDSLGNKRQDYANINTEQPQQYVPYGYYKLTRVMMMQRAALSGGHVGSGDIGWGVNVPWNKFNQTSTQSTVINSAIYIDSSQTWMMRFQASASIPRLFRISIFMTKHGDWIDNGTGGELLLVAYEANQNPLFPDIRTELAMSTCSGTSYYRARPMQWLCSTYYAVRPGYFVLENRSYSFRVQSFSWNIATLPFVN